MSFMTEHMTQGAHLLRHIQVGDWLQSRSHKNTGFLAVSILAAKGCVNLESLKVAGSLGSFYMNRWTAEQRSVPMQERVARRVYREFYPWLEAVGRASGSMYKGLDVLDIGYATWNRTSANRKPNSGKNQEEEQAALKAAYIKSLKKLIRENWK